MRRLLLVAAGLSAIAMVILAIMILLPMPVVREQDARSKETELAAGLTLERIYESEPHRFVMRDGATLQGHRFVSTSPDSLVMLHGACGFDDQLNNCCGMLREATGIDGDRNLHLRSSRTRSLSRASRRPDIHRPVRQ